jgi:threonine dehydrogenase-like Zn-dependent dehydrogenase
VRALTGGRGPDAVIDAVGTEAQAIDLVRRDGTVSLSGVDGAFKVVFKP